MRATILLLVALTSCGQTPQQAAQPASYGTQASGPTPAGFHARRITP